MRLLIDENLGRSFAGWLRERGHDTVTTHDLGLNRTPDRKIAQRAVDEGWTVITRDHDFAALAMRERVQLPGVLIVAFDRRIKSRFDMLLRAGWPEAERLLPGHVVTVSESGVRAKPIPAADDDPTR